MTIHFVYATPLSRLDLISLKYIKRKLWHPYWSAYKWPNPISAPLSITYQIAKYLSKHYDVKLYDLREKIAIKPKQGDILLGHLWMNRETIVWKALANDKFSKKYLIAPYNHDPKQIAWTFEGVKSCDKFFAICGKHWLDSFDKSPLVEFRDKIIQLNMCIDTIDYPMVKTEFNVQGKRKFFYIGHSGHIKGTDMLEQMAASIANFQGGYICSSGEIKGWKKISEPTKLTPDFMREIAHEYDVFINMSRADAQVTTVLEAMSWGFPVACSKESGYTEEDFFYLDLEDEKTNIDQINKIQALPDNELIEISRKNRKIVETNYTWDKFLSKLEI